MKGDYTRDSFDATKHFSRVLLQQGRVQLDADWNEQTSIVLHYLRTLATDLLGPHAGPADKLGFEIITQASFPPTSAGDIDLSEKLAKIEADQTRRDDLKKALAKGDMIIGPGRYYVAGILVENDAAILYSEQLGYPFSDETKIEKIKTRSSALLMYLDVWEREVSHIEDDQIREVALGGPDTCMRAKVMWQIKVLIQDKTTINCQSVDNLPALGTGKLRARARMDKLPLDPCVTAPESRYRGAENQLYRVEIHSDETATGGATFKWSRENGSVVFPIHTLEGTTATLETFGRDMRLGLTEGDWVEILDDVLAAKGSAGQLAQVGRLNGDDFSISLSVPAGITLPTYPAQGAHQHPYLRRWDHSGDPKFGGALPLTEADDAKVKEGWLTLEDGVQIRFSKGGQYRVGDYWLIPTRTATGDVVWPHEKEKDADGNPFAIPLSAHGPKHAYAPLLHVLPVSAPDKKKEKDCRCIVEPLKCAT